MSSFSYYVHPATRDEIFAQFCNVNIDLQDCMNTSRKVIDSEQYLYDWVRKTIRTRADYVMHRNALHGVLDYGLFLSMQIPGTSQENHRILRLFVSGMSKLMDELAKEKGFNTPPEVTAKEKARQVFLQIEKIPHGVLKAAMEKCDMSYTEFLRSEITVVAQHAGLTLHEFLGPATDHDTSPSIAFIRKVLKQYESNAEKVLGEPQLAYDRYNHVLFLVNRCQEFVFNPLILNELKKALSYITTGWPTFVQVVLSSVADMDVQLEAELTALLTPKPVK